MKRLLNAIRDFFYETTDYAIILIVITVIGIILIWRFNILFNFDISKTPLTTVEQPSITEEQTPSGSDSTDFTNPSSEIEVSSLVKITIPSGSSASDIGDILLSKNLIKDKDEFISRSIELKLDTKLKSGEFEIETNTPLDEVIQIISKTN
ncbi:MAG: endolytic transglycosylase MltG [Tissierellales bacterium]|nr:endolytic transglycosylase MltG [Tissierellales bacterium]MBN2828147.1 endolytic transglycosylase MltG [Tissierellales bacterium]